MSLGEKRDTNSNAQTAMSNDYSSLQSSYNLYPRQEFHTYFEEATGKSYEASASGIFFLSKHLPKSR